MHAVASSVNNFLIEREGGRGLAVARCTQESKN